ncbi:hypothetical protein, partial [Mycobacteroides abscessus]|uniref:hypothetical protein n=1 Tax=Mycobacteroides abscessus TaxID=36809 RepID=UPI000FF300AA
IILGKVRPFLRRLAEAHPQVLIIAPQSVTTFGHEVRHSVYGGSAAVPGPSQRGPLARCARSNARCRDHDPLGGLI